LRVLAGVEDFRIDTDGTMKWARARGCGRGVLCADSRIERRIRSYKNLINTKEEHITQKKILMDGSLRQIADTTLCRPAKRCIGAR
jgi:hypothetical protein